MKTIIAIYGTGGSGKSDTVRQVAILLGSKNVDHEKDFNDIITIGKKKIGIICKGDPGTGLDKKLRNMADLGCYVIFCTCRTSGSTQKAITDIANKFDYQIIWTATYYSVDKSQQKNFNVIKAAHLVDLCNQLRLF
jgi:Cdc6-like AAA superfamily ATPase